MCNLLQPEKQLDFKFCHCPKLTCEGMKYFVEECENLVGFVVNT